MSYENLQDAKALSEHSFLTTMSMELHCVTRQRLRPDPEFDEVAAVFFVVWNDVAEDDERPQKYEGLCNIVFTLAKYSNLVDLGIFVVDGIGLEEDGSNPLLLRSGVVRENVKFFATEIDMIRAFVDTVQVR